MSGTASTRWYFTDWMSDQNVRACSLAARGLWMDMLCIAGMNTGKEHGFVLIAGRVPSKGEIARLVCATEKEVKPLIEELVTNKVCSIDKRGAVYCRRMVRGEKARENGKLGGKHPLSGNPKVLRGTIPKEQRKRRRSFSIDDRMRIAAKTGGLCHWCKCKVIISWDGRGGSGTPINYMHIDHLKAIRDGGGNEDSNLIPACRSCNSERATIISIEKYNTKTESGTMDTPPPIPVPVPVPVPIPKESKKESKTLAARERASDWPDDYRERFWSLYPRRTEKKAALAKLDVIRRNGETPWARFESGLRRHAEQSRNREERYIKHPTTWLNRGCWDDETVRSTGGGESMQRSQNGFANILFGLNGEIGDGDELGGEDDGAIVSSDEGRKMVVVSSGNGHGRRR